MTGPISPLKVQRAGGKKRTRCRTKHVQSCSAALSLPSDCSFSRSLPGTIGNSVLPPLPPFSDRDSNLRSAVKILQKNKGGVQIQMKGDLSREEETHEIVLRGHGSKGKGKAGDKVEPSNLSQIALLECNSPAACSFSPPCHTITFSSGSFWTYLTSF